MSMLFQLFIAAMIPLHICRGDEASPESVAEPHYMLSKFMCDCQGKSVSDIQCSQLVVVYAKARSSTLHEY